MAAELAVHVLSATHIVAEIHEAITAPGPALELHLVQESETGASIAWWEDEWGRLQMVAAVGVA